MPGTKLNSTGQRWTNELRNFYITIHYKQSIQYKVADCLSGSPIEATVQHQVLTTDEIKAILPPVKNQDDYQKVWVTVLLVTIIIIVGFSSLLLRHDVFR